MAKLSRAALGTAVGRDYARRGWQISQTGAKPAGGGAYERMGGLDGFYGMQDAMNAGIRPGDPSWFTNPFRNLPGVGESVAAGRQMSMRTGGGRSARTGQSTFTPGAATFNTGNAAFNTVTGKWDFGARKTPTSQPPRSSGTGGSWPSVGVSTSRDGFTNPPAFDPVRDDYDPTGEWEFDAAGYQAAIEAQNKAAQGGATSTAVPDKRQFWRKRRSSNVVPFRPGAAPQGPLQRDAMNRILFGR